MDDALVIIVIIVALLVSFAVYRSTAEQVTITVKHKERVHYDDTSKYLVWSEEGEVFENTDSWAFLKFNSSDIYGDLEIGGTYCVVVAGWRVRLLSAYRNIIRFCDGAAGVNGK